MRSLFYPFLGIVCLITIIGIISYHAYNGIIEEEEDDTCQFCPVELLNLEVTPHQVRVGEIATLIDGLCNHSDQDVSTQLYLGAQSVTGTFTVRTIDLLTKQNEKGEIVAVTDTEEGRISRNLEPGCIRTEPIVAPVPAALTPGVWIIRAHIIVIGPLGRIQNIDETSNPFEVIP